MNTELKKILLTKKNKIIIETDSDNDLYKLHDEIVRDTLLNKIDEIDDIDEENELPDYKTIVLNNEKFNVIITIDFTNYKPFYIEYENGKKIKSGYKENTENGVDKELSKEESERIEKMFDDVYFDQFKEIKTKIILASSLNENLESLGYGMDEKLFTKVAALNEEELKKLNDEIIPLLKEAIGANVVYHPMYPNFPTQVMDMKYSELYFNAILHYWSNGKFIPPTKKEEREQKPIEVKLKYLSLGTESDLHELIKNLMNSAEAISEGDIRNIETYIKYNENYMDIVPETFVNKENLAVVTKLILQNTKEIPLLEIAKRYSTTTDVLRLAAALSGQSAALEGNKIRFKPFSNKERRLIMDLLNKCSNRIEDFFRHRNKWERVCERIHPDKFKKTHEKLVNDLLGTYKFKRVIKQNKKELELYKKVNEFLDKQQQQNDSALPINELEEIMKKIISVKTMPKDIASGIKNSISTYLIAHQNKDSQEKLVITNKNQIDERIEMCNKSIEENKKNISKYNEENIRFATKVDFAIKDGRIDDAMKLLSTRPGEFLRHLNELIKKNENKDEVLRFFEEIAPKASVKVLLSVKGFFAKRNKKLDHRVFLIKGKTTKIYMTKEGVEALDQELCDKICRICENALVEKFGNKEKLNNVYIEKEIEKQILPQDLRSANSSLESYSKGSRFSLSYKQLSPEKVQIMVEDMKKKIKEIEEKKEKNLKEKEEIEKSIPKEEIEKYNPEKKENESSEVVKKEEDPIEKEKNEQENLEIKSKLEKLEKLTNESKKIDKDLNKLTKEIEDLLKAPICKDYNKIRCFIWWTNTSKMCIDIDLSVSVLDENFKQLTQVSFTNLKNEKFQIYHSGDITNGGPVDGPGAAEFIDLDPKIILENGGRYITFHVYSFCSIPFNKLDNCKFGWMERESLKSNEIFEPKTVKQKLDMSCDSSSTTPIIFDCKTNEFIWIDSSMATNKMSIQIENDSKAINAVSLYYNDPMKENLYNLVQMHIKARDGKQIYSEDELKSGDVAFVMENPYKKVEGVRYIRPTDLDVILSEFMTATEEN